MRRYKILHVLGEGGQAQVRLLFETVSSQLYAGKFLREFWDPVARAMFRAEAMRQIRVAGPGVVPIYDYNFACEQPFIVLEYMPRGSLAREMDRRGRIPLIEALRITQEILCQLSHLHAKNVIHRDVKPGNVLRKNDGTLLLNDLGLAATMSVAEYVESAGFAGTPSYAAPEQLRNFATPTSDVFAAGVILNELLTGSRILTPNSQSLTAFPVVAKLTRANPSERPSAHDAFYMIERAIGYLEQKVLERRQARSQFLGAAALLCGVYFAARNASG